MKTHIHSVVLIALLSWSSGFSMHVAQGASSKNSLSDRCEPVVKNFFQDQKYKDFTKRVRACHDSTKAIVGCLVIQDFFVNRMVEKFNESATFEKFARDVESLGLEFDSCYKFQFNKWCAVLAGDTKFNSEFKPCLDWIINIDKLKNDLAVSLQKAELGFFTQQHGLTDCHTNLHDTFSLEKSLERYNATHGKITLLETSFDSSTWQSKDCEKFLKMFFASYAKSRKTLSEIVLDCVQADGSNCQVGAQAARALSQAGGRRSVSTNQQLGASCPMSYFDRVFNQDPILKSAGETFIAKNLNPFSYDQTKVTDLLNLTEKNNGSLRIKLKEDLEKILMKQATVIERTDLQSGTSLALLDNAAKNLFVPALRTKCQQKPNQSKPTEAEKRLKTSFILSSQKNKLVADTRFRHFFGAHSNANDLGCNIGGGHGVIVVCNNVSSGPVEYKLLYQPSAKVRPMGPKIPMIADKVYLMPVEINHNSHSKCTTSYVFNSADDAHEFIFALTQAVLSSTHMGEFLKSKDLSVPSECSSLYKDLFNVSLIGETVDLELKDEFVQQDFCFRLKQAYLITCKNCLNTRSIYVLETLLADDRAPQFIHETVFPLLSAGHLDLIKSWSWQPGDTGACIMGCDQGKKKKIVREAIESFCARIKEELERNAMLEVRSFKRNYRDDYKITSGYVMGNRATKAEKYAECVHSFFSDADLKDFVALCQKSHIQDVIPVYGSYNNVVDTSAFQCVIEPAMYCVRASSGAPDSLSFWFRSSDDNQYYEVSFPVSGCCQKLKNLINLCVGHNVLQHWEKEKREAGKGGLPEAYTKGLTVNGTTYMDSLSIKDVLEHALTAFLGEHAW